MYNVTYYIPVHVLSTRDVTLRHYILKHNFFLWAVTITCTVRDSLVMPMAKVVRSLSMSSNGRGAVYLADGKTRCREVAVQDGVLVKVSDLVDCSVRS